MNWITTELPPIAKTYEDVDHNKDLEVIVQTKNGDMFFAVCYEYLVGYGLTAKSKFIWYTHGTGGRRMKIMSKVVAWMEKPEKFDE